jgi:hypothetical protein
MRVSPTYFLILLTLGLAGCAKTVVIKAPQSAIAADGVIYALPNTVVRVAAKIDKVEKKGAAFSEYAAIFAPDAKPVCDRPDCGGQPISFSVQPGAVLSTYGEPDPEHVYLVRFANGGTIDQTLSMTWNEAGLLSAASAAVTNRTVDIVASGLKLAAGLGTKAAGLGGPGVGVGPATRCSAITPGAHDSSNDTNFLPNLPDQVLANYCAIDASARDRMRYDAGLLKRAADAFKARLLPLLVARENALTGVSASMMEPAAILPRIDTEIASREAALFLGAKATTTWAATFDLRRLSQDADIPLFTLAKDGFCAGSAELPPDSNMMPDEFASPSSCSGGVPVNLKLMLYPAAGHQLFSRIQHDDEEHALPERSFRYRIPAQVKGAVSQGSKQLGAGIFAVAQFGTIVPLPASRHSKMLSYELSFIEATGGLKTFKLGATGGLDSSTVDALAGVAGTALDARNKASDPVAALTREDQILKLKDDICTIQKKYNLPCTVQP